MPGAVARLRELKALLNDFFRSPFFGLLMVTPGGAGLPGGGGAR